MTETRAGARRDGEDVDAAIRVTCEGPPALTALVRGAVAAWLPEMAIVVEEAMLEVRGTPDTACVVLAAAERGEPALERLRVLRAGGFPGGVVLMRDEPAAAMVNDDAVDALGGILCTIGADGDRAVAEAVAQALAPASVDDAVAQRLATSLAATRQRLATADIAVRLQHALNNPLAALMAEAQLLQLEALAPDHREAVGRMVELCQRMVALVRQLDAIRRPTVGPARES